MKKLLLSVLLLTGVCMQNAFAINETYSSCFCKNDGNSVECKKDQTGGYTGYTQSNQMAPLYHGNYTSTGSSYPYPSNTWNTNFAYKCDLGIPTNEQGTWGFLDIFPTLSCDVTKCACPITSTGTGGSCIPKEYCPQNSDHPGQLVVNHNFQACYITPFNGNCDHGDCKLTRGATFDFHTQMGGVDASVYVCEVGFHELCTSAECTQHYLTLDANEDTAANRIHTWQTFTEATAPGSAKVYINDLFFGAEFYVKYCVKAKRLVVGSETAPNYDVSITPSYTISTGNYMTTGTNDYVTTGKLGASIYADCNSAGPDAGNPAQGSLIGLPVLFDNLTALPQLPVGNIEICGTPGCTSSPRQCVYTLRFSETATCYRPFKCVDGVCSPYESTIKTSFSADIRFACDDDGICN